VKIVIFHGTAGSPEGNWFPWLKAELEKLGHEVFVPKLPTPENQSVESWCEALREQVPFIFGKDTILVGHSLGATLIAEILSQPRKEPVKASFFVSGFLSDIDNEWYDKQNYEFTRYPFDWDQVKKTMGNVYLLHGSDDPYVRRELAEELSEKLGVKPDYIENGGHLNSESGYTEFPYLLGLIKKELE